MMKRLKRLLTAKNLLYLSLVCIVILPWLLTRSCGIIHFDAESGAVADTIGGITAPICGFLGAVLVYLALKEQIKANNLILQQFEHQKKDERTNKLSILVTEQLNAIREEVKVFSIVYDKNGKITPASAGIREHYGTDAIFVLFAHFPIKHSDSESNGFFLLKVSQVEVLLNSIEYLLKKIKKSDINSEDSEHLIRVVWDVYHTKFYYYLFMNEVLRAGKQAKCSECGLQHGIPEYIYKLYQSINSLKPT